MALAGVVGVLDRRGEVGAGEDGICSAFPQGAGRYLSIGGICCLSVGAIRLAELGGGGVAGRGQGGGAGTVGALGRADERGDGLPADLAGVWRFGDGVERVQVVVCDDVGDLFPIAWEGGAQV